MKKSILKISILLLIIFFLNFNCNLVSADDIDTTETLNEISINTSANITNDLSNINSRAYVVIDRNTNLTLVGKNENQKRKMASTTKIMTSLIIIENCNLTDTVEISKKSAGTGGSRLGLKTGDKITVKDLLYGLMLCSGNDCAVALAEYSSGSVEEFAKRMNQKASDLGLTNTHFITPHGLDSEEHYTTAYELAILSNYALNNKTFAQIVGTKNYTITLNGYPKSLTNTNELLGNLNGVYGVKTGFTNGANRCLVTACKRNNIDIICVVLGADTKNWRTKDSINLIEYCFNNFEPLNIKEIITKNFEDWKNENLSNFTLEKGNSISPIIEIENIPYEHILIDKKQKDLIEIHFNCNYNLIAPIKENSSVGNMDILIDNNVFLSCNIVIKNNIDKNDILDYLIIFIKDYPSIVDTLLK